VKKTTCFILAALFALTTASAALAQIKYVAVVETELDAQSGADTKMNKAEVRQITAELRSVAVKNLPRDKYNIMTSETVYAQGSAKLEECSEENCVIALGNMIGADYIVRGIISKFGTSLTLSVEMYETEDGNLVATSGLVRSENAAELLEKAAAACTDMYRTFVAQSSVRKKPSVAPITETPSTTQPITPTTASPVNNTVTIVTNQPKHIPEPMPKPEPEPKPVPERVPRTKPEPKPAPERGARYGFTLGYVYGGGADIFQAGFAQTHPIGERVVSFACETNLWLGSDGDEFIFCVNVPFLFQFDVSALSLETGVQFDLLYDNGGGGEIYNAGLVVGGGFVFDRYRIFYRFDAGSAYYSHLVGVRVMF